jgi:hypothetical protein
VKLKSTKGRPFRREKIANLTLLFWLDIMSQWIFSCGKNREGVLVKKVLVSGLVAFLLTCGLVLASCNLWCSNNNNCYWSAGGDTLKLEYDAGGICNNTSSCVIFDSYAGFEAATENKKIPCNCL